MKTIVENSTKLSKYLYEDDKEIFMEADRITIGPVDNPELYVGCHSMNDCTLYENIEGPPDTWAGNKYTFDGTTWTANPEWRDPVVVKQSLMLNLKQLERRLRKQQRQKVLRKARKRVQSKD